MEKLARVDISRTQRRAVIKATGSSLPQKILDNADFEKMIDTSDQWITSRTGIKQRRIISQGQTTATLATEAAQKTLQKASISPEVLDLIICATVTPEMVFPSTACFVQNSLKNRHCCAYDLAAACSGFLYALANASAMIENGQIKNALIIGAETLSTITDYQDRASCILFGDGAGAALLQAAENTDRGVLYSKLNADGGGWTSLNCPAYGSRNPVGKSLTDPSMVYMKINGREVYQQAVRRIVELVEDIYQTCGLCNDDIALVVPHQMNARIIESAAKRLRLPADKMCINIDKYGNTSAASIPIALDEAIGNSRVKQGDLIILVAFGGGLTWAANLIRL